MAPIPVNAKTWGAALLNVAGAVAVAAAPAPVQTGTLPDGTRIGWIGQRPTKPTPTVFFLAGDIERSLAEDRYQDAVRELGEGCWCVTLQLPAHGDDRRAGEPQTIRGWEYRLARGEDVVKTFTDRFSRVLDEFIRQGETDAHAIGVFGTSRGGFMALHAAAADPRVRAVAMFAPVTDLNVLTEFAESRARPVARSLAASSLAPALADRWLWLIIGNADERVGTLSSVEFAAAILRHAASQQAPPRMELRVETSEGHAIPRHSYVRAAQWMKQCLLTPASRDVPRPTGTPLLAPGPAKIEAREPRGKYR
jgi:predicted esterase